MADIPLTGSGRWSNVPDDGIDIAQTLAAAAPPGGPVRFRVITSIPMPTALPVDPEALVSTEILISPDGAVTVDDPRYEPVIKDGRLVALRDLEPVDG